MTARGRIKLLISLRCIRVWWEREAGDQESFSLKDIFGSHSLHGLDLTFWVSRSYKKQKRRVEEEGDMVRSKRLLVQNTSLLATQRLFAAAFEMPVNTDPSHQKSPGNGTSLSEAVVASFWGFCLRRRRKWSLLFALDFSSKASRPLLVCPSVLLLTWFVTSGKWVSDFSCAK